MKRFMCLILAITALIFYCSYTSADNIDYGLYIKSHPVSDNEKTSLVLENNKPFKLFKETILSFDLFVRPENAFGMIMRILTNDKKNIDLYITVEKENVHYPMLLIEESQHLMSKKIVYEEWVPVTIRFSSGKNEISLSYGESTLTVPYQVSQIDDILVSFGLCPFPDYAIYDIVSANIRDVKILNENKLVRYYKLDSHVNNITYDFITQIPAIATNPKWIIDNYSTWEKFYSKQVDKGSLFTFDDKQEKLFIIPTQSTNTIFLYNLKDTTETIFKVKNDYDIPFEYSRLLYDNLRDQLIIYNLQENISYFLSFENLTWVLINKAQSSSEYGFAYNSTFFEQKDSLLISFGGYGYLKYNNELILKNIYTDSVFQTSIPGINPRSYSATTKVDNILYVWGGKGSNAGTQYIFPQFYSDFYALDLNNLKVTKLWEVTDKPQNDFYVGENMVYNEQEDCFYLLADIENMTLLKIYKDKEGYEQMSFFKEEEIYPKASFRNLYYLPEKYKFYAIGNIPVGEDKEEINLYSLNYPLQKLNLDTGINDQKSNSNVAVYYFIALLILIITVFAGIFKFKKKKERITINSIVENKKTEIKSNYYDFSRQSIGFLGGFTVNDKEGNNIAERFSPSVRSMFVVLILYSSKKGKGISTEELIKLFWFDKKDSSAKNIKNVYLSRLRSILENVGKVEIVKENGYWKIHLEECVSCDYTEAMQLLSVIENKLPDTIEPEEISRLLELLGRGNLLPDIETEWVDEFKRDFSNQIIDVLTDLSQNIDCQLNDSEKLKIANILFVHDYLNEEALYLKCSAFINLNKKGIARNIYDSFCKEYLKLLAVKYKYSFSDIINRKNILS